MGDDGQARAGTWPRRFVVLLLLAAGGIVGVVLAGISATTLAVTSTNGFCLSCHEMQPFQDEYAGTTHYRNAAGVRAGCADCHIPQDTWTSYVLAKARTGSRDVWAHFARGLETPEELLARRGDLAEMVWARMQANDSLVCRNCHSSDAMAFEGQGPAAGAVHQRVLEGGERTCIDCHKGLAHALPRADEDNQG